MLKTLVSVVTMLIACLAVQLTLLPGSANAQQKSIKDQLIGAWTLLLDDGIKADGTQVPLLGPNPIGSLIFTPNGRYSVELMRTVNRPAFASNNKDTGTAEENRAAVQGTLGQFGTYTVDEGDKSFVFHVEGCTFPNLEGKRLKFQVIAITDEVLIHRLPPSTSVNPARDYATIETIWRRAK